MNDIRSKRAPSSPARPSGQGRRRLAAGAFDGDGDGGGGDDDDERFSPAGAIHLTKSSPRNIANCICHG
eukprot:3974751-Pyramimonas_sp.AAC.1